MVMTTFWVHCLPVLDDDDKTVTAGSIVTVTVKLKRQNMEVLFENETELQEEDMEEEKEEAEEETTTAAVIFLLFLSKNILA